MPAANTAAMASFARRRTRVVLAIVLLLALLVPFGLWFRDSSLVRVERVTISGVEGAQRAAIRRALTIAAADMTTLHVRERALLAAVAAYPIVRSLRTETDFPHGLRIAVNAYEPVAVVQPRGGRPTPVAGDGTLLRGEATHDLAAVGIRTTPGGDRLARGSAAIGAVRVLATAPRSLRARVARVYQGPRVLAATMESGPKLYFGGPRRLAAKWIAAAHVLAHESSNAASYLDLRIPERPVAGGLKPREGKTRPPLQG